MHIIKPDKLMTYEWQSDDIHVKLMHIIKHVKLMTSLWQYNDILKTFWWKYNDILMNVINNDKLMHIKKCQNQCPINYKLMTI